MPKEKKTLLDFWEDQMRQSHTASNYFFRKSPSHYHMMLLVMSAHKENKKLSVEELKTKLFKTSRPKSALIITEASVIINADLGLDVLNNLVLSSSTDSFLFSLCADITNNII